MFSNLCKRLSISDTKSSQMQLIWWSPWVRVSRNRIDVPDVSNEFSLSLNLIVDCPRLITSALRLCLFDRRKHDGAIALSQHLSEWSFRYTQAIAQLALRVIPGLTNDLILSFMWLKFWRSYERGSIGQDVRDNREHRYVKNLEKILQGWFHKDSL